MKILVVGGSGFIGGDTALLLAAKGHDVTIGARKAAPAGSELVKFPLLTGDYIEGGYKVEELRGFDAVIFAAGSDLRHITPGSTEEAHWQRANAEATPKFFERVKAAGVPRAVLLGSFYPQAAPHLIETVPYVRGRHLADIGTRALASESFNVCSVNPPYVVGTVPGVIQPALVAYLKYALGTLPIPRFAPGGGANFISVSSVSQALLTAVEKGENGKAYLIGDEDLTFKEYLERYFREVGDAEPLPVDLNTEHPLFPDMMLYAGRGGTIYFEPDAKEQAFLGYARNDVTRAIKEIVAYYKPIAESV